MDSICFLFSLILTETIYQTTCYSALNVLLLYMFKKKTQPPYTHPSAILSVALSFHFSSSSITRNTWKKISFLLFCVCMAPNTELPDEYMAFSSSDNSTQISEQSWSTTQFLSPWHWEVKLQIYGTKDNLQVVPPRQKMHKAAESFFCPSSTQPGRANCSGTNLVLPSSR